MKLWSPLVALVALSACRATAPAPLSPTPIEAPRPVPVVPAVVAPVDAGAAPAGPTPDAVVDLDGDGQPDRVYDDPAHVVRQTPSGPQSEELQLTVAENGNVITQHITLDGHPALVVEGSGHDTDHEPGRPTSSDTWGGVGVFEFRAGSPGRLVWEYRVEANRSDDSGQWHFAPQPDGTLLATSTLGDDGPAHTAVTARLTRTPAGVFEQTSCWQPSPPSAPEAPCEVTLGAESRLRLTETMRPTESASSLRAGTRVAVLRRGTVRRGAATLSCVRVLGDATEVGWAFVTDAQRARCTAAH